MVNTFNFGQININEIITEAYSLIGLSENLLTPNQAKEAKRSLNLIFSNQLNKLDLFTISEQMIQIIPGQTAYALPSNIVDIMTDEMVVINSPRQLDGTPSSSSGTAANAFDGDSTTACTETSADGTISYDYGSGNQYSVYYVGIQSNVDITYTLVIEYSYDNSSWYTLSTLNPTSFIKGLAKWFVMPAPLMARAYRIRETGGATLNIQELYFNTAPTETKRLGRVDRDTYLIYPNKNNRGTISQFEYSKQLNAPLKVYLTPNDNYQYILFNMKSYIKDVNNLTDNDYVPQNFLNALTKMLAKELALKFAKESYPLLASEAQIAYDEFKRENVEPVSLRINI